MEQRKKRQSTSCVSVKLWLHSGMHIWVPLSWTQKMLSVKSVGHLELQKKDRAPLIMQHKGPVYRPWFKRQNRAARQWSLLCHVSLGYDSTSYRKKSMLQKMGSSFYNVLQVSRG